MSRSGSTRLDLPASDSWSPHLETFLVAVLVCVAAVALDWLVGEPRRWHPLAGFGRWASVAEAGLNGQPQASARSLCLGALATAIVVTPVLALAVALQFWLGGWLWLVAQVAGVWLAMSLRGLAEHGRAVSTALTAGDGDQARKAVGWVVSRDAAALSDEGGRGCLGIHAGEWCGCGVLKSVLVPACRAAGCGFAPIDQYPGRHVGLSQLTISLLRPVCCQAG